MLQVRLTSTVDIHDTVEVVDMEAEDTKVDVEGMTTVVDEEGTTTVVEAKVADMAAVVDVDTKGASVAARLKRQLLTNKLKTN